MRSADSDVSLIVVAGLVLHGSEILMGKRKKGRRRGDLWEMPGGKVEHGEHPHAALKREWREELDLEIEVHEQIATCSFDLEVKFEVQLYAVSFSLECIPKCFDHEELRWSRLDHAIEFLPCSPAMYLHYPQVREWLALRAGTAAAIRSTKADER